MAKARILVIDDEKEIREGLCRELIKEGYEAAYASDAIDGLSLMVDPFHVAIVDLRMPKMDGLDFIRTMLDKYPSTQIIIITGHGDESDAIEAVKLHVSDYIKKGDLTIGRLLGSIEQALIRYKSLPKISKPGQQLDQWKVAEENIENIRDITSQINGSLGDEISRMRGES